MKEFVVWLGATFGWIAGLYLLLQLPTLGQVILGVIFTVWVSVMIYVMVFRKR